MPQDLVDRLLTFAGVTRQDTVYHLGSGDGRIVITAAKKYGARGVGIEIDPSRVAEARKNAQRAGVSDLVTFQVQDVLEADVSPATVVTLFLTTSTGRSRDSRTSADWGHAAPESAVADPSG
jgi:tRNA/tmRNA/rRNA uracil-C5-methylase (TrmA/RlmC/RlmD family)